MSLKGTTPERQGEHFLSKTKYWNKKPGSTDLKLQDWRVISFYKKFLTDWRVIVRSLNKETACKKRKPKRQEKERKNQAP
jgi:hypothetical protein